MSDFSKLALVVQAEGRVLSSNLEDFRIAVREQLTLFNTKLNTDEEFGQAESDLKGLKNAEQVIKDTKEKALADCEELYALLNGLDEAGQEVAAVRLNLEKQIKNRKEQLRKEIINDELAKIDCAVHLRSSFLNNLEKEAKAKRTLETTRLSVNRAVVLINAGIKKTRAIIDGYKKSHGDEIAADHLELEIKSADTVAVILSSRVSQIETNRIIAEEKERTEQARQEAEEAKQQARPVTSIRVNSFVPWTKAAEPISEEEEFANFIAQMKIAFAPLKKARQEFIHPANKAKVETFSIELNTLWRQLTGKGSK